MDIAVREPSNGQTAIDAEIAASEGPAVPAPNDLDSEEAQLELTRMTEWYCEARDLSCVNRAEMVQDHAYYDNHQWTAEEKATMERRGQAPLTYNKAALTIDWLTGTERRTRVDYAVHPRNEADLDAAKNKEKLLKFISDVNRTAWERSRAFKDAIIGGLGWTEQGIRGDSAQEMLLDAYVPWQQMWMDPFSRDNALKDCRYVTRRKWADLDFASSLFPDRIIQLRGAARSHLYADEDLLDDELDLPQPFRQYDTNGHEVVARRWSSSFPTDNGGGSRLRVPLAETYWRCPRAIKKLWGLYFQGVEFDPSNIEHKNAHESGYYSLTDGVANEIRISIWVPGAMLYRGMCPFKHGQFPFTPIWGKRDNADGMPYGVMRGLRDAQDDLNQTRSKTKWYLSAGQFKYEESAVDPDEMPEIRRNLAKPNGELKFKDGALSGHKVEIERHYEAIAALSQDIEFSAKHIHDGSGVNPEQLGRDTNAQSGVAIRAKQEEGGVATAEYFDNHRLAIQLAGEKNLSNIEQYMTLPVQIYLAGENIGKKGSTRGSEWLKVNQPEQLPDGSWTIKNSITQSQASFIVDQQDFRESVRQAQSEQLFNMLQGLPPNVQLAILDLVVESTDIPQKDEIVKRLRKISGQPDPDQENDPQALAEQQQREQQQQQQQQQDRDIQIQTALSKIGLDKARATDLLTKAHGNTLDNKQQAVDLARVLEALLPLAPAADRIYDGSSPENPSVS